MLYRLCDVNNNNTDRGLMVIVVGNGHGDTSSNHITNTLRKGMNPIIPPPAMDR